MNKRHKNMFVIREIDDDKMGKYSGMNYYANKELKQKHKLKKNEILVTNKSHGCNRQNIIRHEKIEAKLMNKGMKYKQAHKIAERYG